MVIYILLGILGLWILVVTLLFFKLRNHYYNLISTTRKEKLDDILDLLIREDQKYKEEMERIKKELTEEIRISKTHIQKVGLVRFNPFERVGGEQSFVIAMLDAENSGIILNFIYTKDGLRVYTKRVKKGKGQEYDLSEEEGMAIEKSS